MPSKRPIVAKNREAMRCRSRESRLDRRNHTNSTLILYTGSSMVQYFKLFLQTSREGLRHVAIMRSDEDGTILAHNYTRFRLVHRKRGGTLRGLRIK